MQFTVGLIAKLVGGAVAAIVALMIFFGGTYSLSGGYTAVVQNTITGSIEVVHGPKFGFKLPIFSSVELFTDVSTITFGTSSDPNTRNLDAVRVTFADTYKADISMSFRFALPKDDEQMKQIFRDYRRYENMVDNLFVKNAVNVMTVTATQFTGEEFSQGGVNSYKERLEDQMNNGIYQTERKQVEVESLELASVSIDTKAGTLEQSKQLVWKTVPILDANGNEIRQSNPFQRYGVGVAQLTYTGAQLEELLDTLLTKKKELVGKRIQTTQEQETAKAEADTAQLLKEIERTKAVQDANRQKELAVIAESQLVEVAKQQAAKQIVDAQKAKDLAVIDKQRELEIAQANLGIQNANADAAVAQAKAITAVGFAEADVTKAKYAALGQNADIYLAEVQRDVALKLYENLGNFHVEMPTNLVTTGNGSNGGLATNLDILSSYAALGAMDKLSPVIQAAPVAPAPAQ